MKLLDILACNLESWPSGQPCLWISDAHSATVYGKSGSHEVSFTGGWPCPEDYLTAIVYKSEWQAAVDALYPKLSVPEEWTGVGLPPVGAVCEWSYHRYPDNWYSGTIRYLSGVTCVIEIGLNCEKIERPCTLKFRPIRTPEQIAAEEREAGIAEIFRDLVELPWHNERMAEGLYDAGYRKQVKS